MFRRICNWNNTDKTACSQGECMRAFSHPQNIHKAVGALAENIPELQRLLAPLLGLEVFPDSIKHHLNVLFTGNDVVSSDTLVVEIELEGDLHTHAQDGALRREIRICNIHHVFFNPSTKRFPATNFCFLSEPVAHLLHLDTGIFWNLGDVQRSYPGIRLCPTHHLSVVNAFKDVALFLGHLSLEASHVSRLILCHLGHRGVWFWACYRRLFWWLSRDLHILAANTFAV
mmetsp:Transcript_21075/g.49041  ORF Transcript_21075/g.49041 Transcript_21075/m.49041 type:complete len:229 (+) Transcript_21075:656-1342(+)